MKNYVFAVTCLFPKPETRNDHLAKVIVSGLGVRRLHERVEWSRFPSEREQIEFFNSLDLYHKSPDSGERQYKSRTRKRGFDDLTASLLLLLYSRYRS